MKILIVALVVLSSAFLLPGCGGEDDPVAPADTTPPAAVSDLHVAASDALSVTVAWTAPGDDGHDGTASEYAIRHAAVPLTEANWNAATSVFAPPAPALAGTQQSLAIPITAAADLYVALKTVDDAGNWSGLSNVAVASGWTPGEIRQLTTSGPNWDPCLDDGVVTWVGWTAAGEEIFISNLRTAYPEITVLTDNGGRKQSPSSHGSAKIVWQGREDDGADWEVWVYSAVSTPRFWAHTDNDLPDLRPELAGGGDYAWRSGHLFYEEVMYWNESAHNETTLSETCCPVSEWSTDVVIADGGVVFWMSTHRDGDGAHKTMMWDGALHDLTADHGIVMGYHPSCDGGALAYSTGGGVSQIKYWDGASTRVVADGAEPSLDDGRIAYLDWDGHDWEVFYWDGEHVVQITDNEDNESHPTLDGDLLAWVGRPEGGVGQIFFVELE